MLSHHESQYEKELVYVKKTEENFTQKNIFKIVVHDLDFHRLVKNPINSINE